MHPDLEDHLLKRLSPLFEMDLDPFFAKVEQADGLLWATVYILINDKTIILEQTSFAIDVDANSLRRAIGLSCSKKLNKWRKSFDARYCCEVPNTKGES